MNLDDMFSGEEGHWDFEVLEAAYRFEIETNELFFVYHHIANCNDCYDNLSIVMMHDRLEKDPYTPLEVPKRLSDKLAAYIDSKP